MSKNFTKCLISLIFFMTIWCILMFSSQQLHFFQFRVQRGALFRVSKPAWRRPTPITRSRSLGNIIVNITPWRRWCWCRLDPPGAKTVSYGYSWLWRPQWSGGCDISRGRRWRWYLGKWTTFNILLGRTGNNLRIYNFYLCLDMMAFKKMWTKNKKMEQPLMLPAFPVKVVTLPKLEDFGGRGAYPAKTPVNNLTDPWRPVGGVRIWYLVI